MRGNGSERFQLDSADWLNIGKNLMLYLLAALLTWAATFLIPTLTESGGVWAMIAIALAAALKFLERFTRDTRGTIDGRTRR